MQNKNYKKIKLTLPQAIEVALGKKNPPAQYLSLADCNRGYKNPYDKQLQPDLWAGYEEAVKGFKHQRQKIKQLIKKYFYQKIKPQTNVNN
jgi:hypothetical protein